MAEMIEDDGIVIDEDAAPLTAYSIVADVPDGDSRSLVLQDHHLGAIASRPFV
jgi:hypothetical protein